MALNNCSAILADILSEYLKDKKASNEEKMSKAMKQEYSNKYKETWLELAGENGFDDKTIHYLHQSKIVLKDNLLYLYINEYGISSEQLQKCLHALYTNKSYKDYWFDLTLEMCAMCLNDGNKNAEYIMPIIMFLPAFQKNTKKRNCGSSIKKYFLEVLSPECDLSLIDLYVGSNGIKKEFCELLATCLLDVKKEQLNDNALDNYLQLSEYITYVTSEANKSGIDNHSEKSKKKPDVKRTTVQDSRQLLNQWAKLQESLNSFDDELIKDIDSNIQLLMDSVRNLKQENNSLIEKNKVMIKKLNDEVSANKYVNSALNDEREHSNRLYKQLEDERESKNYYLIENEKLNKIIEQKDNEMMILQQSIENMDNYIEVKDIESDIILQGTLNNISAKVKAEYANYQEYVELKANGNGLSMEDSVSYLEHLLDETYYVLEKNGIGVK